MSEEKKVLDEQYISEWRSMLKIFKDLVKENPPVSKVKADLEELAEEAKNTFLLTPAQKNGITERCANYINGTYGRNLSHSV